MGLREDSYRLSSAIIEGKGKGHPVTGHEDPELEQFIALLFFQPQR